MVARDRAPVAICLRAGVLSVILVAVGCAQDSRATVAPASEPGPSSRPKPATSESRPTDAAEALLFDLDARRYYASVAGMTSVVFEYRPESAGDLAMDFGLRVSWAAGGKPDVQFVDADRQILRVLPPILARPAHTGSPITFQAIYQQGGRELARLFYGAPYRDQFRTWRKRVEVRQVNGRDERTIVLEPTVNKDLRRVEMSIDARGLPWKISNFVATPTPDLESIVQFPVFEEFDGHLVMTSYKETRGQSSHQVVIQWQRVGGFIVPASYERITKGEGGATMSNKTLFDHVVTKGA